MSRLKLLCVLVLVMIAHAVSQGTICAFRPQIAPVFSATVLNYRPSYPRSLKASPGPFLYSLPARSIQVSGSISILGNPLDLVTTAIDKSATTSFNGVCYQGMGMPFFDFFGWVASPRAKFLGYSVDNQGRNVSQWMIVTSSVYMYLDANGDVPTRLIVNAYNSKIAAGNNTFEFLSFTPTQSLNIQPPKECFLPQEPCSNPAPSSVLEMVRLHGPQEYEVAESNTADYVGDVYFTCAAVFTSRNVTDGSSLLSLFNVDVYPYFGRYSFCNYYECLYGSNTLVGRESTNGLTSDGQCNYNSTIGSWYSLPKAAECPEGEPLGESCAWRVQQRVKTVTVQCLLDNGFREACLRGFKFPFSEAVDIARRGLTTEMCPDVPPQGL